MTAVFRRTRNFSATVAGLVTGAAIVANQLGFGGSQVWHVWLAVVALAIGIPHGALDHLVTVPSMERVKMIRFVSLYLAVVAIVTALILIWPLWGFIGVVVMSAVHFGMGDASFIRQHTTASRRPSPWWVYAIPAGMVPVVIPLTREGSADALALVNPDLVDWHLGWGTELFWAGVVAAVVSVVWSLWARRFRDARDITILLLLALFVPPLVAFATYFGFWHALRHTARLTAELPSATQAIENRETLKSLWAVTRPGLPALIGTMAIAAVVTVATDVSFTLYLFVALALVWALTVPHMALTWRLDREALGIGANLPRVGNSR